MQILSMLEPFARSFSVLTVGAKLRCKTNSLSALHQNREKMAALRNNVKEKGNHSCQ